MVLCLSGQVAKAAFVDVPLFRNPTPSQERASMPCIFTLSLHTSKSSPLGDGTEMFNAAIFTI